MKTIERKILDQRGLLLDELSARKAKNPAYSIRAFSRDLALNKTTLAAVLSGKRRLSRKTALQVAERLSLTPTQAQLLLNGVSQVGPESADSVDTAQFLQLQDDQFKLISDWYYFGILNLARLHKQKAAPLWIARRLGISEIEAQAALERLKRMGMIEVENGKLVRTGLPVETTNGIPSSALRAYHRQNLVKAEASLERDSVATRVFSSICVPADPKSMARAAQLIQEFKVRFAELVESEQAKEVYTLAIQYFPITHPVPEEK